MTTTSALLQSISVIKFGPDNILFVGDSTAATIFAFELETATETKNNFNIFGIDKKIADLLGVSLEQISIKDLAIHPISKEAYIAIHRGHGSNMLPVIIKVDQNGRVSPVELEKIKYTKLELINPIYPEIKLWNHVVARTMSITDLHYYEGELLIAGLSNAEFSSTLYRATYPFNEQISTSSIEMFHAVHDQYETRAPIETMTVINLNNKAHLLASYTCTPLVTIPMEQLKNGLHVKGKTIGELGYGNTPIDMIHFQGKNMQGQIQDVVLITHKNRGAMLFQVTALAESNLQEGLTTGVQLNVVAPPYQEVPLAGLLHVDNHDAQYLTALRRDMETGQLNLISFMKGAYFRLSDFVSEYMLPGYTFAGEQEQVKHFQDMMKQAENII